MRRILLNRVMRLDKYQFSKFYFLPCISGHISQILNYSTWNWIVSSTCLKLVFSSSSLPHFLQTLDGGLNVIQLETAVGAAIKSFENSLGINVPRSRFLPVKTTSDLLLVMSNLYSLNAGSLTMSEKREFPTVPLVKLGSSFTKVSNYKNMIYIGICYVLNV